jgi:hypothetical protein
MAAASGKVAIRATYRGTGKGGFILACQPPVRPSRWTPSTSSWSNEQGQIAEHWGMADTIGTVGQLGLLPAPGQAPASISGRASAEQSGFRGAGVADDRPLRRRFGSLGDDGSQFAADAGREVDERGEPAGEDGREPERQLAASGSSAPPSGEPGAG